MNKFFIYNGSAIFQGCNILNNNCMPDIEDNFHYFLNANLSIKTKKIKINKKKIRCISISILILTEKSLLFKSESIHTIYCFNENKSIQYDFRCTWFKTVNFSNSATLFDHLS